MSPRRANPSIRSGLLQAATRLFLAKGFAGTGVEEICEVAGVTKGALFHHFESKTELGLAALDEWVRAGFQTYSVAPFLQAQRAVDRVFGYVDFTIELSQELPIGCLIGSFAQEASSTQPELRKRCAGAFLSWSANLAAMLDDVKREAGASSAFESRSLADHFVAVFEGAQVLAKATESKRVIQQHLSHFRTYLEYLLAPAKRRAPRRRLVDARKRSRRTTPRKIK
jgi:TetR/AcrR family transcriptional repressor of nem operon